MHTSQHIAAISAELGIQPHQAEAVAELLSQEATVPFIARYRKEATGSLDEVQITAIRDRLSQLADLDRRREAIVNSLEKHGHLTEELRARLQAAENLAAMEDIYLPFKPKRRTKAGLAREKGLEPLALAILAQEGTDPQQAALAFVDAEKGVASPDEAMEGAAHILAERINEDEVARSRLRRLFSEKAVIRSKVGTGKEAEGIKFRDYFDWQEPAATAPSHRVLAMRRGEREEVLSLTIQPPAEEALAILEELFVKGTGPDSRLVRSAAADSYKRLLSRALETELRLSLKQRADAEAIRVFAGNLRELLLAPPLGAKRMMGIDPGFRTGCKVVCLDRQGKLLHHDTVYPHTGAGSAEKAREILRQLCGRFQIEAVAVGNGTAGRETEAFVRGLVGLFGFGSGTGGVPQPGPDRARRRFDRAAPDGPAGRAGQDRPQIDRRRPIPARCGPGGPEGRFGRCGGQLRQCRGRGCEPGQRAAAHLCLGVGAAAGPQHRGDAR